MKIDLLLKNLDLPILNLSKEENFKLINEHIKNIDFYDFFSKIEKLNYNFKNVSLRLKKYFDAKIFIPIDYKRLRNILVFLNKVENKSICCYCSDRKLFENVSYARFHIDHIMPSSKGGKNNLMNLRLVSPDANLTKNNKIINSNCEKINLSEFAHKIEYKDLKYFITQSSKFLQDNSFKNKSLKFFPQQIRLQHVEIMFNLAKNRISNKKSLIEFILENKSLKYDSFDYTLLYLMFIDYNLKESKKELNIEDNLYHKYEIESTNKSSEKKILLIKKMYQIIVKKDKRYSRLRAKVTKNDIEYLYLNLYIKESYENETLLENDKEKSLSNVRKFGYFFAFYFSLFEIGFFDSFINNNYSNEEQEKLKILYFIKESLTYNFNTRIEVLKHKHYNSQNIDDIKEATTLKRRTSDIRKLSKEIESYLRINNYSI